MTQVFGSTVPPSGLSGRLRARAFRYSENDLRHWLMLLLADCLNMGEGLVSDLARGHLPNFYVEMGGPAALRYNPAGAVRKAAVAVALLAGGIYLLRRRRTR